MKDLSEVDPDRIETIGDKEKDIRIPVVDARLTSGATRGMNTAVPE